ncbi:MAG TPA: sigma-70 family RNA polymerase sigma factor [Tepidisphaeraceae bacterium]|nr:sigma-70 family RNA polymerase sigma factor [Tepidisphaeraceae bacterium]
MSEDERPGELPDARPGPELPDPAATIRLFERALRSHSRRLLAIARSIAGNRAAAEDIVQQAMTNLYEHRDRYDWREPGGLMRRAVVNEALRVLRQPRMTIVGDEHPSASREPVDGIVDRETITTVRAAIDRLPEHFRAALVLCEYENMPYAQIAEVLGCSVPQVKTWLHRGRKQLARILDDFVKDKSVS